MASVLFTNLQLLYLNLYKMFIEDPIGQPVLLARVDLAVERVIFRGQQFYKPLPRKTVPLSLSVIYSSYWCKDWLGRRV